MPTEYIEDDVVRIYEVGAKSKNKDTLLAGLCWGDAVKIVSIKAGAKVIDLGREDKRLGVLPKAAKTSTKPRVLKVRFVDVGVGDGAMIELPTGQLFIIDGGEDDHFRRYFSKAFGYRGFPVRVDAAIATHGDADHFDGLTRLLEGIPASGAGKPPKRVADVRNFFHNGLVKRAAKTFKANTGAMFGATARVDGATYCVELVSDPRELAPGKMSKAFARWARAVGSRTRVDRLQWGDGAKLLALTEADPKLKLQVLGPIVEEVRGKPALRVLGKPGSKGLSDSHTVNGHSVVLKATYGNVRFLFGADLNEQAEATLLTRAKADSLSLAAEVLKVPHHGSADFDTRILEAIRPVVSVVSSGDESAAKDYIHPRAGLVGALGRFSRAEVDKPLVYVTEMVAFFERTSKTDLSTYRKKQYGIVHVRTDGERVLVTTHSAQLKTKEAYVFRVSPDGGIRFEKPSIR